MGEMKKNIDDVQETMKVLSKEERETMHNFRKLENSVLEGGVLDTKTKELIALGTAITARCKYCIGIHVQKSLAAGATKEEILEAAAVAILMGGAPAMTYVTEVRKSLEEFRAK
ncbi:MAG: carboxymuconolactone decarboxylase family protein [Candidatus Hadarchaeota archaeon]|nr:carboxymuconolactone decarboxylase family protein [Candidatus Hadarchaeota archaeon]